MSITETIPSVSTYSGVVPDKATQTKTEFANNVQPYLNYINASFVPQNNAVITSINTWATEANTLRDEISEKEALVSPHYDAIDNVSNNIANINSVANNETNINNAEANAQLASTKAEEASNSASLAAISESNASASANNKGDWSALTGALNIPATVNHNGDVWILNTDLADVTSSEPTDINTDWTKIKANNDNPTFTGSITEQTATATDVLEPDNGTLQYRTLAADTTFTDGLAEGQTLTLYLTNAGFIPTYPIITWDGGVEPTLGTTDRLYFEKVNSVLYGFHTATF